MRLAPIFTVLLLSGAFALAGEVEVTARDGRVDLAARDAPANEVLERLRGHVKNLIFDAAADRRVTVDLRDVAPAEAVRRVAAAAGLEVEEAGGVLLVRRPRAAPKRPAIRERGGAFFAPAAFDYPVVVLRRPEDEPLRKRLSRFEVTEGISLLSAPDLEARVIREYLEARHVYEAMAVRAGMTIDLPADVTDREVRIYVEAGSGRHYAEVVVPAGERELTHLVYQLAARTLAVEHLSMFRAPIPLAEPAK